MATRRKIQHDYKPIKTRNSPMIPVIAGVVFTLIFIGIISVFIYIMGNV
jgi:hypothetical protein